MSQSPSYQTDTASASPESPKEGDFSTRQLSDNLKSLEEQETCDDQKDPIVNIIPDNYSSCLLNTQIRVPLSTNDLGNLCADVFPQEEANRRSHWTEPGCSSTFLKEKLPVLPEFMEVRALDGRFITLVSSHTQTDWEWVEQSLSFSCQVQKEIEELLLQAEVVSEDTVPESLEETEDDAIAEDYDIPCVGLPRLIAYKPEPKQIRHVRKVPEVQSKQDVHLAQCDYCQQLCQPFIHCELLQNETDFERLICCDQAKQMRELILKEREKLAENESDRKIDVNPNASIINEEERETARALARKRLRYLQIRRNNMYKDSSHIDIKHKTFYRLSKEIPDISDEPHIPQIDIKNTTGMFILQEETDGKPKLKEVTKKFYKSGKCFFTLFPDGTGNVFYPSGKAAIIISSAEADDFTYIILDDKDVAPSMKAIFTNKRHSTCYHPNGMIWLNLTPVGGLCFSETGDIRRRWNWLYFDPHAHNLPFKPLTFALCPHINVRIHSQERMYVTLAHQENTVRFSVGSKLKLICPESHGKLGEDVLEGYIKRKSSEIYSLLGQMQTCMSHHSANQRNIKPYYRFTVETRKLDRTGSGVSSREFLTIHAFDGRVVTTVSVGTQTDWRNEGQRSQDYKYSKEELPTAPPRKLWLASEQSVPKNMKSDLEISPDNEVLNSLSKETPQTPTACQGETEQSLTNLDKISTSSRSHSSRGLLQTALNICCDHCQKLKKPPATSDQIANMADPEEFYCCKKAWKLSEILPKGAAVIAKETMSDRGPAMQKDQRLKGLEVKRSLYRQTPKAGQHASATLHSQLLEDPWTVEKEASFPEIEIMDCGNMFSFNRGNVGLKRETPLVKHYASGQTFVVIFPDGTGQVCYPSGRLAILISAAQSAHCSCVVVLEDNHQPRVQAVFITRGQGTCYHNNGCMWVNLTPWEGTYYSDTGDLKKHWSWLDSKNHVHAPPYQPLCLTLSPKLNIRIQSQEHICINFTCAKYSIQLNVGAKLKLNQGKGLMLPGPDMFQKYLQQKSAEINALLQNMQSLITYQKTFSPQKVKPQQSRISQMERQQLPMKKKLSARKTP